MNADLVGKQEIGRVHIYRGGSEEWRATKRRRLSKRRRGNGKELVGADVGKLYYF